MKNNLISALILSPFLLGLYLTLSDLKQAAFCFVILSFTMFFNLFRKQSSSLTWQIQLMQASFKTHYIITLWALFSASLILFSEIPELMLALLVSSLLAFTFLSWACVQDKVGGSYFQFIGRWYKKNATHLFAVTIMILLLIAISVIELIDSATRSEPLNISALIRLLPLLYCFHSVQLESELGSDRG